MHKLTELYGVFQLSLLMNNGRCGALSTTFDHHRRMALRQSGSLVKPIFLWLPSQNGLLAEAPHLHIAA